MSIKRSCIFLLFLLRLSLLACNARRDLGVFNHKKQHNKLHGYHFSNKVQGDKKGGVGVADQKISISKEKLGAHYNNVVETQPEGKSTRHNDKDKRSSEEIKGTGLDNVESYRRTKKSRVSVSWRVPHKKRGEKQPGFNLDYSPPKTHPPSHN